MKQYHAVIKDPKSFLAEKKMRQQSVNERIRNIWKKVRNERKVLYSIPASGLIFFDSFDRDRYTAFPNSSNAMPFSLYRMGIVFRSYLSEGGDMEGGIWIEFRAYETERDGNNISIKKDKKISHEVFFCSPRLLCERGAMSIGKGLAKIIFLDQKDYRACKKIIESIYAELGAKLLGRRSEPAYAR